MHVKILLIVFASFYFLLAPYLHQTVSLNCIEPNLTFGQQHHMLHDGPFRWVWRLHRELKPSTRAAVRGPDGPLDGRHPAELLWGQFLLHYPPV